MRSFAVYLYGPNGGPLPRSFEQVVEQLGGLPRVWVEPDGSWFWTGQSDGHKWQLDGQLYDHAGQIQYVDLKGSCPRDAWLRLLEILGATDRAPADKVGIDAICGGDQRADEPWQILRLPEQKPVALNDFEQETWASPEYPE